VLLPQVHLLECSNQVSQAGLIHDTSRCWQQGLLPRLRLSCLHQQLGCHLQVCVWQLLLQQPGELGCLCCPTASGSTVSGSTPPPSVCCLLLLCCKAPGVLLCTPLWLLTHLLALLLLVRLLVRLLLWSLLLWCQRRSAPLPAS
jgi:hypothetical protein